MPGIPGFLGIAAFGSIKFAGYSLATFGLRKFEPAITANPFAIAGVRTGVGFVLGMPATFLAAVSGAGIFFEPGNSMLENCTIYFFLFVVRIFIWMLILFLFTASVGLPRNKLWLYSVLGGVVSSLLDWPGYALAIAAPGQLTFC
jgi:hypothetical protein